MLGCFLVARRVFFSFHYERDIWRASQVRNSWVTKGDGEAAGFWDAAIWEAVQGGRKDAVEQWIRNQLDGTSVTVVLIGEETANRPYVHYEIEQSWIKGNGLIGVHIDKLEDFNRRVATRGTDPFVVVKYSGIKTYCYVNDDGYNNLGDWIEAAYQRAQNRK